MSSGGSGPDIPNIEPKTIGQLTAEIISGNIEQLPQILKAFEQFGPEFAKIAGDIFIQAQQRRGEAFPEQFRVLEPLSRAIGGRLQDIQGAGLQGVPQGVLQPFTEALRAAQAARGTAVSPASAIEEGRLLGIESEAFKRGVIAQGIQFSNLQPLVVPGAIQTPETLGIELPDPTGSLNIAASVLEPLRIESILGTFTLEQERANAERQRRQQLFKTIGTVVGAAGGAVVGGPAGARIGASVGGQLGSAGGTFF